MEAERNGDEKGKEAVDNDFRKIEEERYKRKEELLSQKDKQEIVDILARELVSVENKINQEIKQRQREEAMHIEDTQRYPRIQLRATGYIYFYTIANR